MSTRPTRALLLAQLLLGACEVSPPSASSQAAAPTPDPLFDEAGFTALAPPAPGSWRARVSEPAQTLEDYRASEPNLPTPARRTLYLLPLGPYPRTPILPEDLPSVKVEEGDLVTFVFSPTPEQLADFASLFWGLPAAVLPELPFASLQLEPARTHDHHAQFDANALLLALGSRLPDDGYSMTVLTTRDLVVDGRQEFAYGYGLYTDRLAVASFAQLDPQWSGRVRSDAFQTRVRERAYKLLAHELGHTLGIGHCAAHACVMNGIAHLDELDATPLRLCPLCLRKLLWLVELDPLQRYRALAAHYETHGLDDAAVWVRERIDMLSSARAAVGMEPKLEKATTSAAGGREHQSLSAPAAAAAPEPGAGAAAAR